jgi:hypothetical protein
MLWRPRHAWRLDTEKRALAGGVVREPAEGNAAVLADLLAQDGVETSVLTASR